MSRERKQKLAQSRRRNVLEEEDGDNDETGPALIDDSASEASDDDLQLSGSDNDEEDEEEERENQNSAAVVKESISPPTSESYDRLEDDTLQGGDFVDLAASNGSVGASKLTDTAVILNRFKDIPTEENGGASEGAMQFDEWDNTTFEPLPSQKAETTAQPPSRGRGRGGARDRPDRETYWQRRNREKEEYKKRLEDPTFTPYVGEFFMHDSRKNRQFDLLNQFGPRGRGRGRGGRGFRGGIQRDLPGRNGVQEESSWGHDGFEELEPQQSSQPASSRAKAKSQASSAGRQTPLQNVNDGSDSASQSTQQKEAVQASEAPQNSRNAKTTRSNVSSLASKLVTVNISLPNAKKTVKDVTLNSYVGRIPYQKPLRGDRPVKITSIDGAGNREIYPSKERSWLPYFLKNAANVAQTREAGIHSRGASITSTGTPSDVRPARNVNGTPNKVVAPAVTAEPFTPHSPAPMVDDEDDKPARIKVNLPPITTASSASPAESDSSSLHVHHPRPQKHINIADIDDSSARLKAFLNPQTSSSPAHSHERTPSAAIPETAVHAAPFQPTFLPGQQPTQQVAAPFAAPVPFYYPPPAAFAPLGTDYSNPSTQNPYLQPRFESNGMVYYYDPSFYYFQPNANAGTPVQSTSQPTQPTDQPENAQMYYYQDRGIYYPYPQGT